MAATKEPLHNVNLPASSDDETGGYDATTERYATAYDVRDMNALGLLPTFRRRFNFLAMVGFSSTVVTPWETTLVTFSFALFDGGTGGLFCMFS